MPSKPLLCLMLALAFAFLVLDAVWLPFSSVDADMGAVKAAAMSVATPLGLVMLCVVIDRRLRGDAGRISSAIRYWGKAVTGLGLAAAYLLVMTPTLLIANYLMMSAGFPLQDAAFASFDRAVGFDWTGFLAWTAERPLLTDTLVWAYGSVTLQMVVVLIFFAAIHRFDRVQEFVALYGLTAGIVMVVSMLLPAMGAYAFHRPDPALFVNMTDLGYKHIEQLEALRGGSFGMLTKERAAGIVSFPSFHTALALVVTWACRGKWFLFAPALVLNALVIVSTLPVGGHYLVDLFGGALVTAVSIAIVRALMQPHGAAVASPALAPGRAA